MKSLRVVALTAALLAGGGAAQALVSGDPPIQIDLYASFAEDSGNGISFSDFFGQQTASDINFLPAAQWWPLGDTVSFGALLSSGLNAAAAGSYTLTMGSDDASYLFIDGALVLALPDAHSYYTAAQTVTLSAGYHTMSLQFYNSFCCGSQLTLDPGGLAYVNAVPEPASAPLWLGGLMATGWAVRRWRRGDAVMRADRPAR